jgi:hypothetical protein
MDEKAADLRGHLADEMGSLRSDLVEELAKERVALMDRLGRLQDAITAIRDDGVNMSRADRAHQVADTREELRSLGDLVNAMTRQINRLQTEVRQLKGDGEP